MTLEFLSIKQLGERGWQERVQLPVDRLLAIEQLGQRLRGTASSIHCGFEVWRDKMRAGYVCLEDYKWDPGDDVATSLIDVSPSNPLHYRFTSTRFRYFHWMTGKHLADFPHREIVRSCGIEYHACKDSAAPAAHHISHDLGGFRRDYVRLLLPLTDRTGRVSALACISRHLDSLIPAVSSPATPRD